MSQKLTPEEKAFNAAQCSICLLDWPMAQCLACKFHQPEVEKDFDPKTMEMHMYNGWTPEIPVITQIFNLIQQIPEEYRAASQRELFVEGMNDHDYKRHLLGYVIRKGWITDEQNTQAAEIANDDNWLGMFETLDAIGAFQDGRNEVENKQIIAYFGRSNVTTSAEWRKHHLNQTAEQVNEAKANADTLKGLRS